MELLREGGFDALIAELVAAGTPLFGCCLGMQLLFDASDEHGGASGLGLIPGTVRAIDAPGSSCRTSAGAEVRWRGRRR